MVVSGFVDVLVDHLDSLGHPAVAALLMQSVKTGAQGVKAKIDEALEKTDIDDKIVAGITGLKDKIIGAFKKED